MLLLRVAVVILSLLSIEVNCHETEPDDTGYKYVATSRQSRPYPTRDELSRRHTFKRWRNSLHKFMRWLNAPHRDNCDNDNDIDENDIYDNDNNNGNDNGNDNSNDNSNENDNNNNNDNDNDNDNDEDPPYSGTVYMAPELVSDSQPTTFKDDVTYVGRACRELWEWDAGFVEDDARIFDVVFSDGVKSEMWVSSKIEENDAVTIADETAFFQGQLPQFLRRGVRAIMITKGNGSFGGNQDGHISFYDTDFYTAKSEGWLQEVLAHEAAHATLDSQYYYTSAWEDAVSQDPGFISDYAEDYPQREDIAESIVPWLGIALNTLNDADVEKIKNQMPNRLKFFDDKNYNLFPLDSESSSTVDDYTYELLDGWYYCD